MARPATTTIKRPALRLSLPRPTRRIVAAAVVALAVLVPAAFWVRDSSLVAVKHVEITGVSGDDASAIRSAIADAAGGMTTLHVQTGKLEQAVSEFPAVRELEVQRDFPHTLRVVVHERVPVAALAFGSRREAVAADGRILADSSAVGLPLVKVASPPGGDVLAEKTPLKLVRLLGAAPRPLLKRVARATMGPRGLTVLLVRGPKLYFGPGTRLEAKWLAAARVLEDKSSRGARYIELRVPERPAAGGLVAINPQPGT